MIIEGINKLKVFYVLKISNEASYLRKLIHYLRDLNLMPHSAAGVFSDAVRDLLYVIAHGSLKAIDKFSHLVGISPSKLLSVFHQLLILS